MDNGGCSRVTEGISETDRKQIPQRRGPKRVARLSRGFYGVAGGDS